MGRVDSLTREVRRHDSKLFVKEHNGALCLFRMGTAYDSYDFDGMSIIYSRPHPYFVFSLTEDWTLRTKPVEWGAVPLLDKIKSSDLWNRDIVGKFTKQDEKDKESEKRSFTNMVQDYAREDLRWAIKKDFKDINTSTVKKLDRRRIGDKKYGNR